MLSNAMKNKPANKEDTRMGHIQCERLPKSKMAFSSIYVRNHRACAAFWKQA